MSNPKPTQKDLLEMIDSIEDKLPKGDVRILKLQLLKSLIVASADVSLLIKRQDFEGVEQRLRQLHDEQMEVRAEFTVQNFQTGGVVFDAKHYLAGTTPEPVISRAFREAESKEQYEKRKMIASPLASKAVKVLLVEFARYMEESKMYERNDEGNVQDFLDNFYKSRPEE